MFAFSPVYDTQKVKNPDKSTFWGLKGKNMTYLKSIQNL